MCSQYERKHSWPMTKEELEKFDSIDSIPDWATHIAQDENGEWFAYSRKPTPQDFYWDLTTRAGEGMHKLHKKDKMQKIGKGERNQAWRESLITVGIDYTKEELERGESEDDDG